MSTQFYILWQTDLEEQLFRYVKEECDIAIFPASKPLDKPQGTSDARLSKFFLVRARDAGAINYAKFRDDYGKVTEVISSLFDGHCHIPYIEYTQGIDNNVPNSRVWMHQCNGIAEDAAEMRRVMIKIRKWAEANSQSREKVNRFWIYSV